MWRRLRRSGVHAVHAAGSDHQRCGTVVRQRVIKMTWQQAVLEEACR